MRLLFVLSFLACSPTVFSQVRLEECLEKAQRNYPLVQQYGLIEQSRDYSLSNANKAYLPQLSVTAIGGIIDGFPQISLPGAQASEGNDVQLLSIIQFNQVLWDGGVTKSRKEFAEGNSDIQKAEIDVDMHQLTERVSNIFFGILLIDEQKEQLTLQRENLERNRKKLNTYIESGVALPADRDEVDYQLLNLEQKAAELEYNRKAYIEMLSLLVGEEISMDAEFIAPVLETNYSEELNRPELELFDAQLNLLSSRERMNKSKLYPKFGLMGFGTFVQPSIPFGTTELDRVLVAGLSLSWEIGGLYQSGNDKKLLQVDYDRISNRKETFLFATKLELSRARSEIEKLDALVDQDKEMLLLKKRIKVAYQSRFDNGSASMNDLLDKINDEAMAQQNLVLHEMQQMMAVQQYKIIAGNQ